jgi:DNA polymerase III sliding clamp (beta) subunit (PCNA family)
MKQSTFVAALKFAMHAAAQKDIRYYLNGVLFEFVPTGLIMVGTDGHRMAYVEIADDIIKSAPYAEGQHKGIQFIVETTDIKLLFSAMPAKSTGFCDIRFSEGDDNAVPAIEPVLTVIAGDGRAIVCRTIKGHYPDWRRVCKSGARPTATETIGFNADYMAAASKACGAFDSSKYAGVTMTLHGASESMLLKPGALPVGVVEAAVIVMPTRI